MRAKHKIKAARIPYLVPAAADLSERLRSVLLVFYLIYNSGIDDRPAPKPPSLFPIWLLNINESLDAVASIEDRP